MLTKYFTLGIIFFSSLTLGNPRVITTTEDLASLTRALGGDFLEVSSIARGTQDPHFIEAKPSYLVSLSRADLLIAIGLSLEQGWLPLLQRGARNPKVLPGARGFLDVSSVIEPLEVNAKVDRSEGDVHPEGNPHFMADPERGLRVLEKIKNKLVELDASQTATFEKNFAALSGDLKRKTLEWKERLAKYRGTKIFGYHKSFNYFFKFFGFEAIGYLEPKPGIPPTAQHILGLIDIAKRERVKLIVMEDYFDSKAGRTLSEKLKIPLIMIPAYTGGNEKSKSYLDWLEHLVSEFERNLK